MNRRLHLAVAVAFLVAAQLFASPAGAAESALGLKVGGHAGVSHTGGDIDSDTFIGGGVVRMDFLWLLTGELAIDYKEDSIGDDLGDISTVPIQLSALIRIIPVVYGTVGVGWYNVDASEDLTDQVEELDDVSDAALHLGLGAEFPVSNRWSVIGDYRYIWLKYDLGDVGDAFSDDANFYTFTGGLLFRVF
jgi:Outer membrane protein beta-barrel domain